MQSNTTRALGAQSMLSALPVFHNTPAPRTRDEITARVGHLRLDAAASPVVAVAASCARPGGFCWTDPPVRRLPSLLIAAIGCAGLLGASNAADAGEGFEVNLPFVETSARNWDTGSLSMDFCARGLEALCPNLLGGIAPDTPLQASADVDGASAAAAVGSKDWIWAAGYTHSTAGVQVLMYYVVEDPQNRPQIKTILDFTGVLETIPDPPGRSRGAGGIWYVTLGESTGGLVSVQPTAFGDGSFMVVGAPQFVGSPVLEFQTGVYSDNGGDCLKSIAMHGVNVSYTDTQNCSRMSEHNSLDLTHAPGTYLLSVTVTAQDGTSVAADPVLRPHPDNPDVIVKRLAPTGSPGTPLAVVSPANLAEHGMDPTPFIEAGFFDPASPPPQLPPPPPPPPSADTTPPGTTASAMPDANLAGWNNAPVTVMLSAADNAGGSGVKEVHYSLSGASAESRVVSGASATLTISAEGVTTLSYFAVDNAGNQEPAKTFIVRIDKTAPSITGLPASGCVLWPPDHRLVQVASVTAADGGAGIAGLTVAATSTEPETGTGDGDVGPDVIVTGGVVQLRAERAGNGAGRIYTIAASATDQAGNVATQTRTCVVPHDRAL